MKSCVCLMDLQDNLQTLIELLPASLPPLNQISSLFPEVTTTESNSTQDIKPGETETGDRKKKQS